MITQVREESMRLAIIGAGLTGLTAARTLRLTRPAWDVVIFEKSRGLGGRAATRRRDQCAFDHGAQLFKLPSAALERLVREELPSAELTTIAPPVWTFDAAGQVSPGDHEQNAERRYTYRDGISRLGRLLGEQLDVRRETRVAAVHATSTQHAGRMRWTLTADHGVDLGSFDAVVFTAPAPQTADLLRASALDPALAEPLLAELARASYRRCLSVTLAVAQPLNRPYYALINTDRAHPVSWLALEHVKAPERCPPGQSLITVQYAPGFSAEQWDTPLETLGAQAVTHAAALLGADLGAPLWSDRQGWRYALPAGRADFETLNRTGSGLYFAGDFTAGQGRVHLAIEQGWQVAAVLSNAEL
jgi:renalase